MKNQGFTLIEIIIYIGLFSIMIGGLFVSVFQIIQNLGGVEEKITVEEEMNFVVKKIDWALNEMTAVNFPLSGTASSLDVDRNGDDVEIGMNGGNIAMCLEGECFDITSVNVNVDNLVFEYLPAIGSAPVGIRTTVVLNGRVISFNKYLRP